MAFVMGAAMMVVMLAFMWGMYKDRTKNFIILGMAAFVFALALWLVRSKTTVTDTEYMRAMIPHHSLALMTSERAHIRDPPEIGSASCRARLCQYGSSSVVAGS